MKLFKGKRKGVIHTTDITLDDIRSIFFPKNFREKYKYLGSVPWNEESELFKVMEPLIIFMDYKAKPKWCPRFVLRFLHLFGSDNSIVRVRNQKLHNLKTKLTKGIMILDYKTKWSDYDLRISIAGDVEMWRLATAIEEKFYKDGYRKELIEKIREYEPEFNEVYLSTKRLEEKIEKLEKVTV